MEIAKNFKINNNKDKPNFLVSFNVVIIQCDYNTKNNIKDLRMKD